MHNKTIVLDSCVFNKLFLDEYDSYQAIALINEVVRKNVRILAPSLFVYEVLSIAHVNTFSIQDAYELILDFQKTQLHLVEVDQNCIKKVIEICEAGHKKSGFPSFYDASYHALAIENECYFITADKRHFDKTVQLGHVSLLSDWENIFKLIVC